MGTAFNVYMKDTYFPHIENKKISNKRNLRYHGNNIIKLSYIYLEHFFQCKFSYERKSHVHIYKSTPGYHIQKK